MNTVSEQQMAAVKIHIRNLIQGHAIGKKELVETIKSEILGLVKDRIEHAFSSFSVENFIQQSVRKEVNTAIARLLPRGMYSDNERFESLVRAEVNKQVQELISTKINVTISEK